LNSKTNDSKCVESFCISILTITDIDSADIQNWIRGRPQSEGGCPVRTKRVLQMRTFRAKNFGFFEIYGVSTRKGRVEPVRTFCGHRKRVSFLRFCADVFYGRPLRDTKFKKWKSV